MKEQKTKHEVLENIKRLRNLQLIELEKLGKSMTLEDMFPDKPFPMKMKVVGRAGDKPYELATAYFTFADKTEKQMNLTRVPKKLWPERVLNQFNDDEKRRQFHTKKRRRLERLKQHNLL